MMLKTIVLAAAVVLAVPALAQAPAAAPASAPTASKAKKELVAKVLQLQHPGIEAQARLIGQQPALQLLQQASVALQGSNLSADKRESVAKDIQADAKKYADDAVPVLTKRAVELAPVTIGPFLEEQFSEAELKQLIGILESPAFRKYQSLSGNMQRTLTERLVAETRSTIEPKVRALQQSIAGRLNPPPAAPSTPASPPGPASAPAR